MCVSSTPSRPFVKITKRPSYSAGESNSVDQLTHTRGEIAHQLWPSTDTTFLTLHDRRAEHILCPLLQSGSDFLLVTPQLRLIAGNLEAPELLESASERTKQLLLQGPASSYLPIKFPFLQATWKLRQSHQNRLHLPSPTRSKLAPPAQSAGSDASMMRPKITQFEPHSSFLEPPTPYQGDPTNDHLCESRRGFWAHRMRHSPPYCAARFLPLDSRGKCRVSILRTASVIGGVSDT